MHIANGSLFLPPVPFTLVRELLSLVCSTSSQIITQHLHRILERHSGYIASIIKLIHPELVVMRIMTFMVLPGHRKTNIFFLYVNRRLPRNYILYIGPELCERELRQVMNDSLPRNTTLEAVVHYPPLVFANG